MPDYGGITFGSGFGGGWGNSGFGGGSPYGPSRYGAPNLPRAGFQGQLRNFTMGGTNGQGIADAWLYGQQAMNANATAGEQEEALFNQSINERNLALQHRYAMEMQQAQLQAQQQSQWNQMMMAGINLPTNAQIDTARGRYGQSAQDYRTLADRGMYTDNEFNTLLTDAYDQSMNTTRAMQSGYADLAKSQGAGLNPNALYAMSNAGQYDAAAQRHNALAGLTREQAASRERGIGGYAGIQGQLADLDITPTRENAWMGMFGGMGYNPYGGMPGAGGKKGPRYGDPNVPMPQRGRGY